MPRRARIRLPNVPLHIVQRGVDRSACFFVPADRAKYLEELRILSNQFGCSVHAYVLMTNHVHLLLTPEDECGASLLMKNLNQRYVQYVNRSRKRTGGLWEGRYRSSFVDREHYLMCCYRYIELNPVRARMVQHPRDYEWSSYRVNAEGMASDLIVPHSVFLELGRGIDRARDVYRQAFDVELDGCVVEEIRTRTNAGLAIGHDDFVRRAEAVTGRRLAPARKLRGLSPKPG